MTLRITADSPQFLLDDTYTPPRAVGIKQGDGSEVFFTFVGSQPAFNYNLVAISADIIGQRRTTNAQRYWWYNTYTDDSNYEVGQVGFSGNTFVFQAFSSGTGVARNVKIQAGGVITFSPQDNSSWGMSADLMYPVDDVAADIGTTTSRLRNVYAQGMVLVDGITAPSTVAGHAVIYVDTADGDLKIKFGDGTVKTIVVDT